MEEGDNWFLSGCSESNVVQGYLKKIKGNEMTEQGCYHYVVKVFQKGDSRVTEVLQKGTSKKTADNTNKTFLA